MRDLPKILHLFWDGSPMSYLNYLTLETFYFYNREWEIRIYTPSITPPSIKYTDGEQSEPYTGPNYWDKVLNLHYVNVYKIDITELGYPNLPSVQQSDIFRWWILASVGGVWSDFDILYTNSIPKTLLPENHDSSSCYVHSQEEGGHFKIGFLASYPNNKFFTSVLGTCKHKYNTLIKRKSNRLQDYQIFGKEIYGTLVGNLKNLKTNFPETYNIKCDLVYPVLSDNESLRILFTENVELDLSESIGVHWYNGSDIARAYINNLEHNKNNNSVMSNLIKNYENIYSNSIS